MSNEDSQSMGAMFNQRRAQRQQQSSGRSPQSGSGSFADIQREQQLDQNQHHRSGRRGRDPPRSRLGGGGARRGGHSRGHHGSSRDHLPVERGRICSLRENFGFAPPVREILILLTLRFQLGLSRRFFFLQVGHLFHWLLQFRGALFPRHFGRMPA